MDTCITSTKNDLIKRIRRLNKKKYRDKYNEFLIEGIKIVDEFLQADAGVHTVLFSDRIFSSSYGQKLISNIKCKKIRSIRVKDSILKSICNTKNPQGILAVASKIEYSLDDVIKDAKLLLMLDDIQDPGNVGTIIRTADAVKADGILVSPQTADIFNDKTIRSTMGSILRVPVVKSDNLDMIVQRLKSDNFFVYAADVSADEFHFNVKYPDKVVLLIGNESRGISEQLLKVADGRIKIPMPGGSESLNVSIATAVILYELLRQRIT